MDVTCHALLSFFLSFFFFSFDVAGDCMTIACVRKPGSRSDLLQECTVVFFADELHGHCFA